MWSRLVSALVLPRAPVSRSTTAQSLTPLVQLLQPPASSPLLVLPTWLPSATQERLLYSFPLMAAPTSASTELLVLLLRSPIHLETRREQSHSVLRALSQPSADHPYRFSSAKVTNPLGRGGFFYALFLAHNLWLLDLSSFLGVFGIKIVILFYGSLLSFQFANRWCASLEFFMIFFYELNDG